MSTAERQRREGAVGAAFAKRGRAPRASDPHAMDLESRAHADQHEALRVWLRLLTCTQMIEGEVRAGLRARFATTLPRFDLMAQLERSPEGLRMGELSRRLMVTGGNVTGITDQLVAEGLVERAASPADRRAFLVRLTAKGRRVFDRMAAEHERWIVELVAGLTAGERRQLHLLLGKLKRAIAASAAGQSGSKRAALPGRMAKGPSRPGLHGHAAGAPVAQEDRR
jgi:DNA-binding MarR family transcriptional regulator